MRRTARGTIQDRLPAALDDLAVFVSVARHASFAESSRRLRIPTSSVSRAVARLEEQLGVSLLRRTSRAVALTPEGHELFARAAPSVDGLREALSSVVDRPSEPAGLVRVTAPAFTGAIRVARSLAAFARAHPGVTIELDATNAFRDLLRDGYDFGIRVGPHVEAEFVARRIWQGAYAVFASRDFVDARLRGKPNINRAALEELPCVVLRPDAVWRFRTPSGDVVHVSPRARFVINDPRAVLDVTRQGIGIALVPADAAAASDRTLVRLSTDFGEPEPVDLYVVYPTKRLLPHRVRMAIDWLTAETS